MTDRRPVVCTVIVGPDDHGVVRHALSVAAAAGVAVVRLPAAAPALPPSVAEAAVVHLHFTDRLFGPDAASSALAFGRVVDGLAGRCVVTLHDVPEPTGTAHAGRRIETYRTVARRADAVVVCSEHERRRLRAVGIGIGNDVGVGVDVDVDTSVIPLPIPTRTSAPTEGGDGRRGASRDGAGRTVGVLGFIYPGKGHAAVLDAVQTLPDEVAVVALGRVSVGHDDLLTELLATARMTGRRMSVSGALDDADLDAAMALVDVPVVPASTTSASSSLCSWIAAGRRPLAAANGFTCEIASIAPDLLTLYRPGSTGVLREAIVRALGDPASTWHGGTVPGPLRAESVAVAHLALYRRVAARP